MAKFHVGQRVRIVKGDPDAKRSGINFIGREATIIGPLTTYTHSVTGVQFEGYKLAIDSIGCVGPSGNPYAAEPHMLAPLTDPKADAFLATVRSWGPLKERMTLGKLTDEVLDIIRGGSQ